MNTSVLSEKEKSVLLARAMGWHLHRRDVGIMLRPDQSERWVTNLYDTANMALAWRVLNWVSNNKAWYEEYGYLVDTFWSAMELYAMPLDEAIRMLLDTILERLIDAGLVNREMGIVKE